jgi:hypothetical protein
MLPNCCLNFWLGTRCKWWRRLNGWVAHAWILPRYISRPTTPLCIHHIHLFMVNRLRRNFDGWDVINLAALAAQDSCDLRDGSRSERVGHPRWVRARTVFIRDRPGRAVDARDTAISFEALRLNDLQRMPLKRSPGFTRSPRANLCMFARLMFCPPANAPRRELRRV